MNKRNRKGYIQHKSGTWIANAVTSKREFIAKHNLEFITEDIDYIYYTTPNGIWFKLDRKEVDGPIKPLN